MRDEGAGIPEAYRQIVFEKYGRFERLRGARCALQPRARAGVLPAGGDACTAAPSGSTTGRGAAAASACGCRSRGCRCSGVGGRASVSASSPRGTRRDRARVSVRLEDETPGTRRLYAEYRAGDLGAHRPDVPLAAARAVAGGDRHRDLGLARALARLAGSPAAASVEGLRAGAGGASRRCRSHGAIRHPGSTLTRHEIAIGQGLVSALLIHLSGGGQSEMHRCLRSLAFLAMYRDPTVRAAGQPHRHRRSRPAQLLPVARRVGACCWSTRALAWFVDPAFIVVEDLLLILAIAKSQNDILGGGAQAGHHRLEPRGARARGGRAPAHRAAALAAVRDHPGSGRRRQPARGGAVHPAHHGREPGLARGRAVGGRGGAAIPALRRLWHAEAIERWSFWSNGARSGSRPTRGLPGRVWQRHLPLWISDLARGADAADGGFRQRVGAARRVRHPAAQRSRGDRRDGLLQPRRAAGQRRSPLDAERAGRTDRAVHGAQAGRAGAARQRGALPLGDRGARRGDHPGRRRRAASSHPTRAASGSWRGCPSRWCGGPRSRPSPPRSTKASSRSPATRCRSWSRCVRGSRGRTWCWA